MTTIRDHALIGKAKDIPVITPTPVISVSPIVLPFPHRLVNLQIRVSAPTTGNNLPIILLSHGHGRSNNLSSLNGYGPLYDFWAGHGFIVIQPTHLSSKTLSLDESIPGAKQLFWRSRVEDMTFIIDHLDQVEDLVPAIKGRLDRSKIAVVGHSMGGHTASMLLGSTLTNPDNGTVENLTEPRIKAGILIGSPGNGGDSLSTFAFDNYTFFRNPSFAEMKMSTLVVAGDADGSPHLTTRGAEWHMDPYYSSPGPKSLLTVFGGEHGFGGIAGYDVAETTDESVERVAAVQRLTWAYLRSTLYPEDPAWSVACAALKEIDGLGKVESK
ncbi:Alpha/Beta hydrolase protein [Tricladium varicosporioides]|nr:Alpha/Beta hydrolase protein [Hymenoscyphus varicosporioides]